MPLFARTGPSQYWRACLWVLLIAGGVLLLTVSTPDALAGRGSVVGCGGQRPPKPGGGRFTCTFFDEFRGSALDGTKWWVGTTAATGFQSGGECYVDSGNNISVADGLLSLTVRKEAAPFTCVTPSGSYESQYTSGTVNTVGRFSQAYGRFEVRAKFPAATVAGLQSSLWLWPVTNKYGTWPTNGEIDIAEAFSQYPDRVIPYVHYTAATRDPNVTNTDCRITPGAFHTYAAVWTPTTITITFDGKRCLTDTWNPAPPLVKPQPFDQPFVVALTQGLGVRSNAATAGTPLPATTQIDYVRVWS